jgi:hypothetical protein
VAASPEGDVSALDAVPSSVKGIPVRTVEEERPEQTACYTDPRDDEDNDGKNEIHGGMSFVGIKNAGTSDSETAQKGTLCCRVYKNGTKYMLTARHPIVGGNCKYWDITDNSYAWGRLNQNEGYKRLGRISHAYQKFDTALLNRRFPGYDEFTYEITEELSGGIIGRVTGDGIDVLNSEPLGEVHKRGQIQTTATQQDTDSGGPVYVRREDGSNPDDLYLLHIATRQWKESGDALGSSANVMNSEENIRFGGTPFDP